MSDLALPRLPALSTFFHVTRFHIITIACLACLTFGWLFTTQWLWAAVGLCALDWFIVNLVNRVADLAEDRANGIVGTQLVADHGRAFEVACGALLVGSLVAVHFAAPALTPWRVAFHAIGLAYNYKLLPGLRGRTRFKEIYFLKNFSSGVLFILSTMLYPLSLSGAHVEGRYLGLLIGFFLALEITYEIIYDLRDVTGDRALNVPTFPVVHGVARSHAILYGLLGISAASLAIGGVLGVFHLKELVLVGGVIQQGLYFKLRLAKDPTKERCIFITWLGAAQIFSYQLWIVAGLPIELP
jgi:4-hydroxybenzoate polyprenyltransferase